MRLPFKRRFGLGYKEKEIPILFNIGTLEAACKMLGIELYQIKDQAKEKEYDFILALLYQGYITACKEQYRKPKYKFHHAVVWKEYISATSQEELKGMITELFGYMNSTITDKKKGPIKK